MKEMAEFLSAALIGWSIGTLVGVILMIMGIKLKWINRFMDWLSK